MKVKDFICRTRPKTKKQIDKSIKEIEKQIHYLKSIGKIESLDYLKNNLIYLKKKRRGD